MFAFKIGERSVKRNSSCRLLGIRIVCSAALHFVRSPLSLPHSAQAVIPRHGIRYCTLTPGLETPALQSTESLLSADCTTVSSSP